MTAGPVGLHSEKIFAIVVKVLVTIYKNLVVHHFLSTPQLFQDKGQVAIPRVLKLDGWICCCKLVQLQLLSFIRFKVLFCDFFAVIKKSDNTFKEVGVQILLFLQSSEYLKFEIWLRDVHRAVSF